MEKVSIFDNLIYENARPAIHVLLNNENTKEVRIAFRKNQEMKAHKSPYPIVIHVIEGCIDFGALNERHILTKGTLIALEASAVHDLKAVEDSIVRLSLNKSDSIERVEKMGKSNTEISNK